MADTVSGWKSVYDDALHFCTEGRHHRRSEKRVRASLNTAVIDEMAADTAGGAGGAGGEVKAKVPTVQLTVDEKAEIDTLCMQTMRERGMTEPDILLLRERLAERNVTQPMAAVFQQLLTHFDCAPGHALQRVLLRRRANPVAKVVGLHLEEVLDFAQKNGLCEEKNDDGITHAFNALLHTAVTDTRARGRILKNLAGNPTGEGLSESEAEESGSEAGDVSDADSDM